MTNEQLAAALKADDPELRVSGAYLSALRTGKRSRPSMELQVALARHFGVPVTDLMDVEDAGHILNADQMDDLGVRSIATRAVGLDNESLLTVAAVLDHVRRLQGLPEVSDALNSPSRQHPEQ
ncbi:helix-turn-helix transcriptional regulator [Gordonia sp. (in: high G+C Gram-positive bacteria)]|uniref:helix-turn-helix transcriptional regulator n=1 Tax=Gordonia sp. (in: high G+C Gram-positive bacteria) TaxID=84139 RepID=UPI003F949B25